MLAGCSKPQPGTSTDKSAKNEIIAVVPRPRVTPAKQPHETSATTTIAVRSPTGNRAVEAQLDLLDPMAGGWQSEGLAGEVQAHLDSLRNWALDPGDTTAIGNSFVPGFTATMAENTAPTFASTLLTVSTNSTDGKTKTLNLDSFLTHLTENSNAEKLTDLRFKIIGITRNPEATDRLEAEVFEESVWDKPGATIGQRTSTWHTAWKISPEGSRGDRLQLTEIRISRQESATASAGRLFADATDSVFEQSPTFHRQVMRGIGYWSARLTRVDDMHLFGHHGIAVGDADGDGLDDLYVCDGGGLANQLYLQNPDGTVREKAGEAGVDWLEDSRSALFVDLDNDGDQDLVVATVALVIFCENDGHGQFTLRGGHPGAPDPHSLCAADYDLDGDVDIYVCSYGAGRGNASAGRGFEASSPLPFNDANNGGRNLLLGNHGSFRFSDVTAKCNLDQNNMRWSFSASWEDFDNDGDQDLYVANDFGRNNLFRNDQTADGSTFFTDVAAGSGVEDQASGMSVDWSDINGDGRMDLYVGNMYSAAGNRVTFQKRFTANRAPAYAGSLQRMARGNTLFSATADNRFEDVSVQAGVNMGRWAWGSKYADPNYDGSDDIVVANGYLTNTAPDDL
ncbi:MAG: VCBS repeat-containing protein [Verrucomicrobiales bacterium]|nr:VCBS repeat-containing protein [Verrucomicrobiales bacterium]